MTKTIHEAIHKASAGPAALKLEIERKLAELSQDTQNLSYDEVQALIDRREDLLADLRTLQGMEVYDETYRALAK